MDRRIVVVTDSTASLPGELVRARKLRVVPLQVVIGARAYDEGPQATPQAVADALRQWTPVSTSRPTPRAMLDAYERAAADGAEAVVSVHLSAEISGTFESAQLAAQEASIPVFPVDSQLVGMGTGFAALAAADAVDAGASAADAAGAAYERASRTAAFFYVDTLEYLRRGGRIGPAAAFVGSALSVKPILEVLDGRIVAKEKVRTSARALHRLEELAVAAAGSGEPGSVDIAVQHLANPSPAGTLAERLRARLPQAADVYTCEVGAVIGAHVGPGMVAAVVAPR